MLALIQRLRGRINLALAALTCVAFLGGAGQRWAHASNGCWEVSQPYPNCVAQQCTFDSRGLALCASGYVYAGNSTATCNTLWNYFATVYCNSAMCGSQPQSVSCDGSP